MGSLLAKPVFVMGSLVAPAPDARDNELIFSFGQIIYQKVKNYKVLGA
jgi:hypothetical protein